MSPKVWEIIENLQLQEIIRMPDRENIITNYNNHLYVANV